VFTSGLLIHIHPQDIKAVMKGIYRCSKMFIIGNEYWHNEFKEVPYRGKKNMLWKADYANLYLKWL
jgi:hypothetical protein